jgi:pimeloyl-ACP methyl ester carboxylesterase
VTVKSRDGTPIAYDRQGDGPPLILVGGGATDRSENAPLAAELAGRFTVFNYDRRGRGASGDTQPYALEREIEDLSALIDAAGGASFLHGVSSGGALVLEAAAAGVSAPRLAVYEVPYQLDDDAPRRHAEYVADVEALLAEGRRGDAFARFMRLAGSSEEDIAAARSSPVWPDCEAIAHTLVYDAACLGDGRPPTERLATITQPTLVANGATEFFHPAAEAIAAAVPNAQRRVLADQGHVADPKAMAAVLTEFFAA